MIESRALRHCQTILRTLQKSSAAACTASSTSITNPHSLRSTVANQAATFNPICECEVGQTFTKASHSTPAIRRRISRMLRPPSQLQVLLEEDHRRIYLLHRRGFYCTSLWGGIVRICDIQYIGASTEYSEPHGNVFQCGRTDLRAEALILS